MPAWEQEHLLIGWHRNLFTFSVVRIPDEEFIYHAHPVIAEACIERDSWGESNSIH
jgi:hypothetical protein